MRTLLEVIRQIRNQMEVQINELDFYEICIVCCQGVLLTAEKANFLWQIA